MFSANISDRHPRFTFFEDFDDLAFAVPAPFHAWLLLCLLIAGTILGELYHYCVDNCELLMHVSRFKIPAPYQTQGISPAYFIYHNHDPINLLSKISIFCIILI